MKLLHTSDWHVGKAMRGQSRADEHREVLAEIAGIAAAEEVDLVLVTGDLFETSAPSPESEAIVYEALLALAATGARVVVIGGNHDNPRRLAAVAPLLALGRITVVPTLAPPEDGGVVRFRTDGGEAVNIALLPFVSQRRIVDAAALMATDAAGHSGAYAEHLKVLAGDLARAAHRKDEVNLLAAHLMVSGAALGGGERPAHTIMPYALGAGDLPDDLHYVALGHLHRQQRLGGSAEVPKWYAGSPLQLDFGEEEDRKAVLVVDASAGRPAAVRSVPLDGGRALRTVRGSMLQLRALAGDVGDAWLRVEVDEPAHAGLADEVREILPNAVQVTPRASEAAPGRERVARLGRSPDELFTEYLAEHDVDDPRLVTLFRELHDQLDEADDAA